MSYIIKPNLLLKDNMVAEIDLWRGQVVESIVRREDTLPRLFSNDVINVHTWIGMTTDYFFIMSIADRKIFLDVNERELLLAKEIKPAIASIFAKDEDINPDLILPDILRYLGWSLGEKCRVDVINF